MASLGAPLAQAEQLTLLTEEYPPFNMSDAKGKLVGISTDIVRALMRHAHVDYAIALSPWMRAMANAQTRAGYCAFSMSRLPERENQYSWVGPIAFNDWVLFGRSGARHPASLAELKGAHIGSYLGDGGVAFLQRRGFSVDIAPNDELNPKKLQMGRIDYWAAGRLSGQFRLKEQKIDGYEPVLKLDRSDMYLACHPRTPAALVARLNQGLAELQRSGVIAGIYASYGYAP
ncbi:MAG: transporter substrate-binding domain-containing protein [Pseudomonadota bacterium]